MDAHVFRRIGDALAPLLTGARLEKIASPAAQIHIFTWYARQRKQHLILRWGRKTPFLYLSAERPQSPPTPTAFVMRLRKHCAGRRVSACVADWPRRRLCFLFQAGGDATGAPPPPETWLVLDLREGPLLLLGQSPEPPQEPLWPEASALEDACTHWRDWPVLTPALRRTLPLLEPLDQAALLADLEVGGGDLFTYASGEDAEIFAWPLPSLQRGAREETAWEDPLVAAAALGGKLVLGSLAAGQRAAAAAPHEREAARLSRLLQKLDEEETRLRGMADLQRQALALQGVLWRYGPEERAGQVTTEDVDCPVVSLDPRLSVRRNMEALFHRAARGKRGLTFVEERRRILRDEVSRLQEAASAAALGAPAMVGAKNGSSRAGSSAAGPAALRVAPRDTIKGVQVFRASDGFVILRGRDARGNQALLRAASGHDLWLHVEGGPGAHALIRRAFPGQEIPEGVLREAGALVKAKSWQKDSPWAMILCAEARHVKPLRGAAPGTVRVDKVALTFRAEDEPALEDRVQML